MKALLIFKHYIYTGYIHLMKNKYVIYIYILFRDIKLKKRGVKNWLNTISGKLNGGQKYH